MMFILQYVILPVLLQAIDVDCKLKKGSKPGLPSAESWIAFHPLLERYDLKFQPKKEREHLENAQPCV